MAARKKAVAKAPSTAIADIQKELAAAANDLEGTITQVSGNKIKVEGKKFTFPDGVSDQGPIDVVIVDFVSRNMFYHGAFDSNNITPPDCFAIGKDIKDLKPSPNSPDPQAEKCSICPMNQFGSDGKGKACKNRRYMAVVLPDDVEADSPLMTLETSPTASKGFDAYVNSVRKLFNTIPVGVVTEVSFDPTQTYSKLVFSDPRPNENLSSHVQRWKSNEALDMLSVEPEIQDQEEAPAAKKAPTRRRRR